MMVAGQTQVSRITARPLCAVRIASAETSVTSEPDFNAHVSLLTLLSQQALFASASAAFPGARFRMRASNTPIKRPLVCGCPGNSHQWLPRPA